VSIQDVIECSRPKRARPVQYDYAAIWLANWMQNIIEAVSSDKEMAERIAGAVRRSYGV
jgi:hypothetical protein